MLTKQVKSDIIKRSLESAKIPCHLEPTGLFRSDGKRPDGASIVPWKDVKVLMWDIIIVVVSMYMYMYIGCWFGDPQSEKWDLKVWVGDVRKFDLQAVDCQIRVRNLCRKLMELLFSEEELKHGNATEAKTSGVTLLESHT